MITANVLERVVHVFSGAASGTGFTIDHDGAQYLVTARHVVESYPVEIRVRGSVVPSDLERLPVPVVDADVAVFRCKHPITPPNLPLPAGTDGLVFGQDAYFLGFPLGLTFDIGPEYFPLIKRCTLSAINHRLSNRAVLLLES